MVSVSICIYNSYKIISGIKEEIPEWFIKPVNE